jgi:hypothetical protein
LISVRSEVQILPGPLFRSQEPGAGDQEQEGLLSGSWLLFPALGV